MCNKLFILLLSIFPFCKISAQSITISEINYKSDATRDAGDWIELHNFGSTTLDISGYSFVDATATSVAYVFPSGTTIAANGYLVVYQNLAKFNAEFPTVTNRTGPFTFGLSKIGETFYIKNALSNTILTVTYADSLAWPRGAAGNGRTLELRNVSSNADLSNPDAWFDGCMGGSPGRAYTTCNDNIVFSEINYNSMDGYNHGEYVELYNRTASAINLTGYGFRDSRDTTTNIYYFPSGTTLPANGYLVLTNQLDTFQLLHPGVTNVLGNFGFSFDNSGESLRLFNASGRLVFSTFYRDTLTTCAIKYPNKPDGLGFTLELINPTLHMNDGDNWRSGCFLGSPGVAYGSPCSSILGIENNIEKLRYELTPNPALNFLKISRTKNEPYTIQIFTSNGVEIYASKINTEDFSFDISAFENGIYFAKISNQNLTNTIKFLKQ